MQSSPSRGRGGFAPRKGRGGWGRPFPNPGPGVKPDVQKHPLGQLQYTVHQSDLKLKEHDTISKPAISDCHYVTSYNWLSDKEPTVVIPGKPPQWNPPQAPQRLSEDSGNYFRDPNAARYPDYPIAPAVQAILDGNPDFETTSIDLFACGSTVGNLLRFVRSADKAFRFSVEVIGETVFFIRKENDPKELIEGVRGFGHTFPEAYTTWEKEVKGSETHQRIVQYNLGLIKCLIRFECDGYLKSGVTQSPNSKRARYNKAGHTFGENKLIGSLHDTAISQPIHKANSQNVSITIKHGGSEVPQDSIFDLKTRSGRKNREIDMSDVYPLLWIKQIPNFIIAYHDGRGLFEDIRVQNVQKDIQDWETSDLDAIRRLYMLIEKIVETAKQDARGLLEVYFSGEGGLEIRSQFKDGTHALPDKLMKKWSSNDIEPEKAGSDSSDGGVELFTLSYKAGSALAIDSDDDDEELDFTACSPETCGFCGRCTY